MSVAANLVKEVLERYGSLAAAALTDCLARAQARDPVYELAADYPLRGGRALRASYCIAAARAFGAATAEAVESAVSLELFHNAFLVHDDVEDDSEERRGRPALHVIHGVPAAVNAGDALTVLGLEPLLRNRFTIGSALAFTVFEEAERMVRESVEGQALELRWRSENVLDLEEEDYLRMVLKKTCWYTTIYPSRVGAIIGTRRADHLDRFVRFGFFLGAAFQLQDDLLNIVGEHRLYGKEIDGDIREGKRTLMLIHLLRHGSDEVRDRIRVFLSRSRGERSESDVLFIRDAMLRFGSVDHAKLVAHVLAGAAAHEFDIAYAEAPDSLDKEFIRSLPYWVLERT
jgi:geranylgeranyl diphosphate synthase type II